MYESPIKVFQGELETQLEGEILKAVHRIDVTVDRDELIRALRYDREQYQKGFDDARKDFLNDHPRKSLWTLCSYGESKDE